MTLYSLVMLARLAWLIVLIELHEIAYEAARMAGDRGAQFHHRRALERLRRQRREIG